MPRCSLLVFLLALTALTSTIRVSAEEKPQMIVLGNVKLVAPKDWEKKEPKSRIIAYEFAAKAKADDQEKKSAAPVDADGRFTAMVATGGVKANVERWYQQFSQPDGRNTKDVAKLSEKEFGKTKVHLVDITGTYQDSRPAFARQVIKREDYRMLAAIIPTDGRSAVFLKFYGPKRTIAQHEKAFTKMLESLPAGE